MEVVISDDQAGLVVETLIRVARTGQMGDGKIFITDLEEMVRIRTGEIGSEAL